MKGNTRLLAIFFIALTSITGCAWKSVPTAADYTSTNKINYTVGVDLLNNYETTQLDAPKIAASLKSMNVFKDVVFPYRKGDAVDAVLSLSVKEKGEEHIARDLASGFFTLGLAGSKNTFTFYTNAILKSARTEAKILDYNISTATEFSFGQFANKSELLSEVRKVSCKNIAVDLANHFNADFNTIQANLSTNNANNSPKQIVEKKKETKDTNVHSPSQSDTTTKLKKLKELYEAGLITKDEYDTRRTKLLEDI